MKKQPTKAKKCELMRVALSITVAAMEMSQAYRKRRIKSIDTSIMYINAAITELKYGEDADMQLVKSAWAKGIEYMKKTAKPKKQFPSGGVFSNTPPGEAEYVIKKDVITAFAIGTVCHNLAILEDECAKACKVWPDWEQDFKAIKQKYYTESKASTGSTLLENARKLLLSLDVESARRYVDIALS